VSWIQREAGGDASDCRGLKGHGRNVMKTDDIRLAPTGEGGARIKGQTLFLRGLSRAALVLPFFRCVPAVYKGKRGD